MVSIIIPTYNREYCIKRSIDSVLNQSYKDFELIIVDDASDDNTEELISSYTDIRIKYIKLNENHGVAYARNYGMQISIGEYIAFQDSDDSWRENKLQQQINLLNTTQADYSYTSMCVHVNDKDEFVHPSKGTIISNLDGNIFKQLLYSNVVGAPTLVIRRKCYEEIGGFDTSLLALEDYDYALKLSRRYNAVYSKENLLDVYISDKGISSNGVNYVICSCILIARYKEDLIKYGYFNRKVEIVRKNAIMLGAEDRIMNLLDKLLK